MIFTIIQYYSTSAHAFATGMGNFFGKIRRIQTNGGAHAVLLRRSDLLLDNFEQIRYNYKKISDQLRNDRYGENFS